LYRRPRPSRSQAQTNSFAGGNSVLAIGTASAAIGYNEVVRGDNSGAFGTGQTVNGSGSFVLGAGNAVNITGTTGFGDNVNVVGSNNTIAATASAAGSSVFGSGNAVSSTNSFVLANSSTVTGASAIAIGNSVTVAGANAVAIGNGTSANFANSAAIGNGATATRANQQAFGTATNTYTMAGIGSAASKSAQSGPTQIVTADASGNLATTTVGALGLASSADINAINNQLSSLQTQINTNLQEARRGIAATAALAPVTMPSAPGRTTFSLNTGFFEGETGVGIDFAHRLNMAFPFAIHGSSGNGGGNEHVGRLGMTVEF